MENVEVRTHYGNRESLAGSYVSWNSQILSRSALPGYVGSARLSTDTEKCSARPSTESCQHRIPCWRWRELRWAALCAGLRWRWAALALACAGRALRWSCAGAGLRWRWAALALGCAGRILRWAALGCAGTGLHQHWVAWLDAALREPCTGAALALGCAGNILRWAAPAEARLARNSTQTTQTTQTNTTQTFRSQFCRPGTRFTMHPFHNASPAAASVRQPRSASAAAMPLATGVG